MESLGDNTNPGEPGNKAGNKAKAAVVVPLLGLAVVIAGVVTAVLGRSQATGWFAYAPLSNEVFIGNGGAFLSQGTQAGLVIAVVGLLVLSFWAGHRLGRKR